MLRTALFRSSAAAASSSARPFSSHAVVAARRLASPAAASRAVPSFAMRAVGLAPVRYYASGPTLNKTEVEGRILSLLKGFDKVRDFVWAPHGSQLLRRDTVLIYFGTQVNDPANVRLGGTRTPSRGAVY